MHQIVSLTDAQIARFPHYVDKWLKIGLSCEPLDLPRAKRAVAKAYRAAGLAPPKRYYVFDSPLGAMLGRALLQHLHVASSVKSEGGIVEKCLADSVRDRVRKELHGIAAERAVGLVRERVSQSVAGGVWGSVWWSAVQGVLSNMRESVEWCVRWGAGASLGGSVRHGVRGDVEDRAWRSVRHGVLGSVRESVVGSVRESVVGSVWEGVWEGVYPSVRESVRESSEGRVEWSLRQGVLGSVWESVVRSVWDIFQNNALNYLSDQCYGAHDAAWLSFYDFMHRELGIQEAAQLGGLMDVARCCGWWAPYRDAAILQHRHSEVHLQQGVLHRDGGPAVLYRDGFAVWALHGVRVPQTLAETPAEQLDPEILFSATNAQVRAEIVRKIGMERIVHKLGAQTIDRCGEYSLLAFDMRNGTNVRYLQMHNPSVPELWHVEGLPTSIVTVQEALNYRNHLRPDQIDDESGADWYQQGDVILRPQGATKFKSRPIVLT